MSLGSKPCSVLLWGNKIAIYLLKRKNALQSHTETLGYTVAVVAVILPSKVPYASPGWISPALAAGGCIAAPGFLCCMAERSDAAAGSTTWAVTAFPIAPQPSWLSTWLESTCLAEELFGVLQQLTISAQRISV